MSKALQLRNLALAMGGGVDLTGRGNLPAAVASDLEREIRDAGDILVVGRSLAGLVECLADCGAVGEVLDSGPSVPVEGTGRFRAVRGFLDDYALDPDAVDEILRSRPVTNVEELREHLAAVEVLRRSQPLIPDARRRLVVQDLLANRLEGGAFGRALGEGLRILAQDGMLYMTALVADEPLERPPGPVMGVPAGIRHLPVEKELLDAVGRAGFHGLELTLLHDAPVLARDGVEARIFGIRAYKGKQGPCYDQGHAVLYRGPWLQVMDDDDHVYRRGERTAVCRKTYDLLMRPPYVGQFVGLPSCQEPPLPEAPIFDCRTPALRDPAVTKGRRPLRESTSACCSDDAPEAGECC